MNMLELLQAAPLLVEAPDCERVVSLSNLVCTTVLDHKKRRVCQVSSCPFLSCFHVQHSASSLEELLPRVIQTCVCVLVSVTAAAQLTAFTSTYKAAARRHGVTCSKAIQDTIELKLQDCKAVDKVG